MSNPFYTVYHILGDGDKRVEVGSPAKFLHDARRIANDYLSTNPRAKLCIVKTYSSSEEVALFEPFKATLAVEGRLKYVYSEDELLTNVRDLCLLGIPFKFIKRNDC